MGWLGFIRTFLIVISAVFISPAEKATSMEKSFVIDSKILVEKISVTTYGSAIDDKNTSVVYVTDGRKMIENGALNRIKELTAEGKIPSAYYVFISTIDAETQEDKRNTYFFCNDDYIQFFEEELVPRVEGSLSRKRKPEQRSLIGISFGGLNAAYFSGKTDLFQNYALLSPITYPCKEVLSSIAFSENKNLNIIISTGINDAENYVAPLTNLYTSKGYKLKNITTNGTHDFENWNGQLEIILNYFDNENN